MTIASVRQLPGILEVTGEWTSGKLVVTYDPTQVTQEKIIEAIEDLDYREVGTFQP